MKFIVRISLLVFALSPFARAQGDLSSKPEMVFVEGGTYNMGSEEKSEAPIHSVTVNDFSISKYEITVGRYRKFCSETGTQMPKEPKWGWNSNQPIVNVDWKDAVAFCDWLETKYEGNWRLPTEAEWEYAARGGNKSSNYRYSGGNDLGSLGWYKENSNKQPHEVGQKNPNELGLHDMNGNAREWCQDYYSEQYYAVSESDNPTGPEQGSFHSMRGGSWYTPSEFTTISSRSIRLMPGHPDYSMGFRVVLEK